jgi:hypothetical protein
VFKVQDVDLGGFLPLSAGDLIVAPVGAALSAARSGYAILFRAAVKHVPRRYVLRVLAGRGSEILKGQTHVV